MCEALNKTMTDWKTEKYINAVVTDNASNITAGVKLLKSIKRNVCHITCFAHTLNLATQKGLAVKALDKLLTRVRMVVSCFKRSPKATSILNDKIKLLDIN